MNDDLSAELSSRAQRLGVQLRYFDVQGRECVAGQQTLQRIVDALSAHGDPVPDVGEGPSPEKAYQGDGRKTWLLAVQLYAVRSRRNWGHGDFTDLLALLETAAAVGAAGIGLNPLHALFLDRPEQASPYSPNSRLFLNPLYIDVEAIPEFSGTDAATDALIGPLRDTEMVDYAGVATLKLTALRQAHQAFERAAAPERRRDFEAFRAERGAQLAHYAAFETYRSGASAAWWQWPPEWRAPSDPLMDTLRQSHGEELSFHEFVQWIAERQLAACHQRAMSLGLPIGLYIDMAVGVDPAGADAWLGQAAMLSGLSIGAPPDEYNIAGQDWGLTTFSPTALLHSQFAPLRQMLRAAMRHAGAIRLDHVLGLMRIYVVPHGLGAAEGAYLRFPLVPLLSVIAEESRLNACIVVGEDLGTVPEGFRETLADWGVWSYLVMLFEREWDGAFRPADRYMEKALATLSTHDLPTFAGWMSGHDLRTKRAIGINPGEDDDERERSRHALRRITGDGDDADRFQRVVGFLAATPTRIVQVAIEDVLGLADQVNVPGTIDEHPNWRRRLPIDVEDLRDDARLSEIAVVFARAGRSVQLT